MSQDLSFIPLSVPDLGGNEERYMVDALRSSWISSTGAFVDRFARDFAGVCGTDFALSVCNGTAALHLALAALDIGPGDEVIVPSLSYISVANAVRYVGAEPVFADVEEASWGLDPLLLEAHISPRTRAIIAVHLYGHPADMDAIHAVAARHNLFVIEDAAEAHFATYKSRPAGSLGTLATFSFYGNKILTSGEGGAITLNDPALKEKLTLLRGQGMDPKRRYYFPVLGYNFRLTNIACALLCAQMESAPRILARRAAICAAYRAQLAGVPGLGFQPRADWAVPAPWLFCLTVEEKSFGHSRDALMAHLAASGIETRPFFLPIHTMPPYAGQHAALPVTMRLSAQGLNLPTHTAMTDSDVARISDAIKALRT